jgi:hypothetical protein
MEVFTYQIEYYIDKPNETVKAVAYDLIDGWFVFYGAKSQAEQVLRVRATDVTRVVLVAE